MKCLFPFLCATFYIWVQIGEHHPCCDPTDPCDAVLASYQEGFGEGGPPFVLAEPHRWLRDLAI